MGRCRRRRGASRSTTRPSDRRVASLEKALALRLVDRLPRRYSLTPDGQAIAGLASEIEQSAFAIERMARGLTSRLSGKVQVSAPPAFASQFLARRVCLLRQHHPGIELVLAGDKRSVSLGRREADLAIRLSRPQERGGYARKIGSLGFAFYAARGYAEGRPAEAFEFVGYDDDLEHLPQERFLHDFAGERPFVFRSNDMVSLQAAARDGLGLALLPSFMAETDEALVRLPGPHHAFSRELFLVVHGDLRRSPPIRAVMDFLAEAIGEAFPIER